MNEARDKRKERFEVRNKMWNARYATEEAERAQKAKQEKAEPVQRKAQKGAMTPAIERRWGILFFSVVMAFLTLIGGQKGSPYVLFWGYIAYLSYKGDIEQIALALKVVIGINAVVWVGVAAFMDGAVWPLTESFKSYLLAAVAITLAIKLALYAYVSSVRTKSAMPDGTAGTNTSVFRSSRRPSIDEVDEGIYEAVMKELEGGDRRAGVWAKAFAESDGDEAKAKAKYIQYRVQQIKAEAHAQAAEEKEEKAVQQVQLSEEGARFGLRQLELREAGLAQLRKLRWRIRAVAIGLSFVIGLVATLAWMNPPPGIVLGVMLGAIAGFLGFVLGQIILWLMPTQRALSRKLSAIELEREKIEKARMSPLERWLSTWGAGLFVAAVYCAINYKDVTRFLNRLFNE